MLGTAPSLQAAVVGWTINLQQPQAQTPCAPTAAEQSMHAARRALSSSQTDTQLPRPLTLRYWRRTSSAVASLCRFICSNGLSLKALRMRLTSPSRSASFRSV